MPVLDIPARMRAMAISELGGPQHLVEQEMPVPEPGVGEVLIRVATVAANRQDLVTMSGRFPDPDLRLPHVPGLDPAGTVAAVGPGVADRSVGERVIVKPPIGCGGCDPCRAGEDDACERLRSVGVHRQGGLAEYVAVPARAAFPIPAGVDVVAATAAAHAFPVALTLLDRVGATGADRVLVSGAAGALGSAAVQLARLRGARVVAIVGSDDGAAWLRSLPDALAPSAVVDYGAVDDVAAAVRQAEPSGISLHIETAADPLVWPGALRTLARRARVAVIGAHAGPVVEVDLNWLFRQRVSIIGCSGSTMAAFREAMRLLGEGAYVPRIDSVMPLSEARAAFARLTARQNRGKVVLRVTDAP
jgi:NADPH:quinone reductase-like Zn-dependent oxidoreductase